MAITSAIVLYVVIWFMTFFIALPIRVQTQGDLNSITPGTQASAPEHHHLKKKAIITTLVAFALWLIISGIILSGWIGIADLGWVR